MKPLLVALDGSPRAAAVLQAAVAQAKAIGAHLVLLRAIGIPSDLPFTAMAMSPVDVLSVLEQRAKTELTYLARTFVPADIPWKIIVEASVAWQGICQMAQTIDASLIVIGSHGYGGLDRVLGTTAGRVVNHADRSVLVVRTRESSSTENAAREA
jgi:nucleotide-binding universal stress UspA family protein